MKRQPAPIHKAQPATLPSLKKIKIPNSNPTVPILQEIHPRLIPAHQLPQPRKPFRGEPAMAQRTDQYLIETGISTKTLAERLDSNQSSIRVRLCATGSYFGVRPHKLPNGRLLWPADTVERLIRQGEQENRGAQ